MPRAAPIVPSAPPLVHAGAAAAGALALFAAAGCAPPPASLADAELQQIAATLALPAPPGTAAAPARAAPVDAGGVTITPLRFELTPGFPIAAALLEPGPGGPPVGEVGVVVAHGHFGQGKSSPEAQEIAWRLARRGARALIVEPPGVEEQELPGRLLHFDEGAHGRGFLLAGGTSALALQVTALARGLDLLEALGARRFGATGASGGAITAFYLGLTDPRVAALALASTPPLPKEARAGGCACDQLPGWPGPRADVVASLRAPSLWLSDHPDQPPPAGLPPGARYVPTAGPHGYTPEMQGHALAFFADRLGLPAEVPDDVPLRLDLSTGAFDGLPTLFDLHLDPTVRWIPKARGDGPAELDCAGAGPAVLVAGGGPEDLEAVAAAGLRACAARVPDDQGALHEAQVTGAVAAEAVAGALALAARRAGAQGVYAVRAWAVPSAALGLPWVVRDPVRDPRRLGADDPAWVHVPGAWWGAMDGLLQGARAEGESPAELAAALRSALPAPPP